MPGSGAMCYTNYQLNAKSNPYLLQTNANIAGYNMNRNLKQHSTKSKFVRKKLGALNFESQKQIQSN